MSRPLRSAGRLVTVPLIGGLTITATVIPASAQSLDRLVVDVLKAIRAREADLGSILAHAPFTGTLGARESASVEVPTCSGIEYTAQGICDAGCTDFDLTVYDSSAQVLESDILPDDVPVLIFTPAASGITTLAVEMVSCTGSATGAFSCSLETATLPLRPSLAMAAPQRDPPTGTATSGLVEVPPTTPPSSATRTD